MHFKRVQAYTNPTDNLNNLYMLNVCTLLSLKIRRRHDFEAQQQP